MLSSGRDIQILRSDRSGEAALVRGDVRLAAALIGEEFDLFFFPHGVQRLRRVVARLIGDFLAHVVGIHLRVGKRNQQIKQHRVAAFALLKTRAEQRQDRRDIPQAVNGVLRRKLRQVLQIERQMVRQLAAVEHKPGTFILRQQIHHRLAAIARFAMYMLEQQQRGGAATVEQLAVSRLRIQQIFLQQIADKDAQVMGVLQR